MTRNFDVVVVGSGIAGLSFALKLAKKGHRIAIITKKHRAESNTNYAQGGIAFSGLEPSDLNEHIKDTLKVGDGLCDPQVVASILSEGPRQVKELMKLGVAFTQLENGEPSLHLEGGHSRARIFHVADKTGSAVEAALLVAVETHKNIEVFEHHMAMDLIVQAVSSSHASKTHDPIAGKNPCGQLTHQHHGAKTHDPAARKHPDGSAVVGLWALDTHSAQVETFGAKLVMLATGGAGELYRYTTNPSIATADGFAMAWRAGAELKNMEFIQFHPTALYTKGKERFLISEALRGAGARLRNLSGASFMSAYDPRGDLASRDLVARAVDREMKRTGAPHVWLDFTHCPIAEIQKKFPLIDATLKARHLDLSKDWIPVVPACHYFCGGVATNLKAQSSLAGLLACGEVACTGLHGANRLASNSLLEACVLADFSAKAADASLQSGLPAPQTPLPSWQMGRRVEPTERVLFVHALDRVKSVMWDCVGIVRSSERLSQAERELKAIELEVKDYFERFVPSCELLELRNLTQTAGVVVSSAVRRRESRGLHHLLEHPEKLAEPMDTSMTFGSGGIDLT